MKNKFVCRALVLVLLLLLAAVLPLPALAEETLAEGETGGEAESTLRYNAEEDFSDLGSDFWKYYFINEDEGSELTEMEVHGGGLMQDAAFDGSLISCYKYVVGSSDFISDDYHQYLGIWGGIYMHPGNRADVVLSFVAPVDGVIDITATIKRMSASSDGTRLYTSVNGLGENIYPEGQEYLLTSAEQDVPYELRGLSVKRGDEIFFRLNKNGTLSSDATYFSPTVTYTSYTLPADFSVVVKDGALTIPVGGIRLLEAELNVNLGTSLGYAYASSDEAVATVRENGLIYAVGAGTAEITVTEKGTGLSAVCTVTVVDGAADGPAPEGGKLGLILGLSIGGAALVAAGVAVFVLFMKKKKSHDQET